VCIGDILESKRICLGQVSQDIFCVPSSNHYVQNNQSLVHNLYFREWELGAWGLGRSLSERTVALGSLSLVVRARQTSETAQSSEYVAAIMGSRYYRKRRQRRAQAAPAVSRTFALGGAALGLQANLTIFSKLIPFNAERSQSSITVTAVPWNTTQINNV
jgi:hypothetical protein